MRQPCTTVRFVSGDWRLSIGKSGTTFLYKYYTNLRAILFITLAMYPYNHHRDKISCNSYVRYLSPLVVSDAHRMRNASILIAGMRALSNEVCKNIILAGVGSITILEHESVIEEDLGAQFLLRQEDIGRNVWTPESCSFCTFRVGIMTPQIYQLMSNCPVTGY